MGPSHVGCPAYHGRTLREQLRLAAGRVRAFGATGPTAESKLAAQDVKRLRAALDAGRRSPLTLRQLGGGDLVSDYSPKAVAHVLCEQWGRTAGPVPPDAEGLITKLLRRAYVEGVKEGIRRFAWWRDGAAFVGRGDKTLAQALSEAEEDAACRKCGNSGVGFDGLPCACRAAAGGPSL